MKKVIAVVLALAVMSSAGLFAMGIGVQGGGGFAGEVGTGAAAVTFKLDEMPYVFAVNFVNSAIGVTADRWQALNENFAQIADIPLNWYWGYGAYLNLLADSAYTYIAVGPRALAGINMFLLEGQLEIYTQAALHLGPSITLISKSSPTYDFDWGIDAAGGFRWWF